MRKAPIQVVSVWEASPCTDCGKTRLEFQAAACERLDYCSYGAVTYFPDFTHSQ